MNRPRIHVITAPLQRLMLTAPFLLLGQTATASCSSEGILEHIYLKTLLPVAPVQLDAFAIGHATGAPESALRLRKEITIKGDGAGCDTQKRIELGIGD
ncbi:hypothetical protein A0H81_01873 [Grifola frondosa]|uniref:Uncharacterized protein n=1 Tax=Grifola frondosa TaxID=5627 RepID=A0A1C7MLK6_GRIFR|nr:hypothetical protein A0H81_01873 [Grifola frondosa]